MKILIDNGHGENTPGKRSPDGRLREYGYAREIAERVVNDLVRKGYDAERLVKEELDVPLKERVKRANAYCDQLGSKNVLLVSIHNNAAGNGEWKNAKGWEAYTSHGTTRGDKLASCLYDAAEANLQDIRLRKDLSDGDPDKEEVFYILRKTKCAAVLTENLFMDNMDEVEFLLSPRGKAAIAKLHVDGIIAYINSL